jgi:predicted TIM-barrel fold metal-dependent hydrolase
MRVDGHAHLWDVREGACPTSYVVPLSLASVDDLASLMAVEGVDRAVLVQPQVHGSDHRLLMRALARHPDRFVGFGLVDADGEDVDALLASVGALGDLGLAGARIHLIQGAGMHAGVVAAAVSRHDMALELHVDQTAWPRLDEVLDAAGDRLVVIDHLGRPDDPRSGPARAMLRALAARPNVIVKLAALDVVSGMPFPHDDVLPLIADTIEMFGAERLMWGSNFPWSRGESYGASLRALERLGLRDVARDAILGTTADRLFFADRRQAVV